MPTKTRDCGVGRRVQFRKFCVKAIGDPVEVGNGVRGPPSFLGLQQRATSNSITLSSLNKSASCHVPSSEVRSNGVCPTSLANLPVASQNQEAHLLSDTSDTGIADDPDRESSRETSETDGETGAKLDEARVERHRGLEVTRDEDRDDETVNLSGSMSRGG